MGKPQVEFYVHASVLPQGETIYKLCGSKQERNLPEVTTPVADVEVSGLQEGVSLSIDAPSWAIRLTSSAGRAADVARKVAEVDGREFDEDDVVTETAGSLGSVITKTSAVPTCTFYKRL